MKIIFLLFVILLVFILWPRRTRDPYHIVVARYNEDISWLPSGDPYVKVYNKGKDRASALDKNTFLDKHECLDLENIGRESHTYLTYIVDNYNSLPDIVFFTQGSPDHTGGHPIDYFINIGGDCSENYHVTKGPYYDFDENGHLNWETLSPSPLNFHDWFSKYIDSDIDTRDGDITWWMGATFSVKSEKILTRTKEYYQELLDQFPKDHSNPEIGHFFERSWYYMFNAHL